MKISIIIPLYNDWQSLMKLLQDIANHTRTIEKPIHVLVIDDASSEPIPLSIKYPHGISVSIARLCYNVGHQRAIVIGLCTLFASEVNPGYVIVMDADGEDKPEDICTLVDLCHREDNRKIVFARRQKRQESYFFRFYYGIYKRVFTFLTGEKIAFGNFSCIPADLLSSIVHNPLFWNHYSAAVIKSKIPYTWIPSDRGRRYFGQSKMHFNHLFIHGLSSLSIFFENIVIKFLKISIWAMVLILIFTMIIACIRYLTDYAIPGWASFLFAIAVNMLITVILFAFLVILLHLGRRDLQLKSPLSFYREYIFKVIQLS